MMFWELPDDNSISIIEADSNLAITYAQLRDRVGSFREQLSSLSPKKQVGIIFARNTIDCVVAYLAALNNKDTVMLLDAGLTEEIKKDYIQTYNVDWVFDKELIRLENNEDDTLYPELAVLLTTSGSTGSPKLVQLSYNNLQSNAVSIANYLNITAMERPITTLSMAYSYGLSVINSHILQRATIILTDESVVSSRFWELFKTHEATSFAAVPYLYQMLYRLKFEQMELPSLRSFTQAGGRLAQNLAEYFYQAAKKKNCKFTMMYGQTEATARISYVPFDKLPEKMGSIGIAIPDGKIMLNEQTSELIYIGPNVMLGYAETRKDLTKGDILKGSLQTGDIGRIDEDGYFWLEGRIKRFIKLYGLRMNLDDLERYINTEFSMPVACVGSDDILSVIIEGEENVELKDSVRKKLKERYRIHHLNINIVFKDTFPLLENGKIDYGKLNKEGQI
ncbi:AMP-binding protein [Paenibacillus sp. NFR01]|uniref:AMP-binding protein n=1 Tax=Paenibacillus sp. NFR01 TaxID=1566279 RepID=UPI0008CB70EA|nr:AMP-binding protein [Paenibacillus sp. NFR01]SEU10062.1 Acyl-CoA synthetase (AMP-forming)/AMP-acid ligase II [Paenibacillus sp. NFR01]